MSEKKSKSIFLVLYGILIMTMLMCSGCSTSKLSQKQIKINYELDKLYIDYKYKTDSLYNEFNKKEKIINNNLDDLLYYIEEDVFNGNLDSSISYLYIDVINEIKSNCENCD